MHFKTISMTALIVVCAAITGCATSRSEIRLSAPAAATSDAASDKSVLIRSVVDERTFEQKPRNPSTPSLGFGGADKAAAEVKARAIGRKRNTYGKALGDVLLEDGQTVEGIVRDNLTSALRDAGYAVVDGAPSNTSTLIVDVHIKQFWAWFQPGFWAIKLNADIATELAFEGAPSRTITVHVEDKRQMAPERAWMEIVTQALDAYRAEIKAQSANFPTSQ